MNQYYIIHVIELGGIYLDNDVLVLKSFDPLRNYSLTLGRETKKPLHLISNGIIIGRPGSMFLRAWITTYRTFNPKEWAEHSTQMAARSVNMHELSGRISNG
jgi:mannosyltransferase OCH1-like enzyme